VFAAEFDFWDGWDSGCDIGGMAYRVQEQLDAARWRSGRE